jgi:hypothetical protein
VFSTVNNPSYSGCLKLLGGQRDIVSGQNINFQKKIALRPYEDVASRTSCLKYLRLCRGRGLAFLLLCPFFSELEYSVQPCNFPCYSSEKEIFGFQDGQVSISHYLHHTIVTPANPIPFGNLNIQTDGNRLIATHRRNLLATGTQLLARIMPQPDDLLRNRLKDLQAINQSLPQGLSLATLWSVDSLRRIKGCRWLR